MREEVKYSKKKNIVWRTSLINISHKKYFFNAHHTRQLCCSENTITSHINGVNIVVDGSVR